jgi:CRP-like cAMP-binding protein/Fe-S-cluster-containing hydrogenase component 2
VSEGRTVLRRREQYRDRWSSFGERTGLLELSEHLAPEELARYEVFRTYDPAFLEKISADVSVARWRGGTVLFEEGAYIDLAFVIVKGHVEVFLGGQGAEASEASQALPIFDASRTAYGLGEEPVATPRAQAGAGLAISRTVAPFSQTLLGASQQARPGEIAFLTAMDFNLTVGERRVLVPGEVFGEIGAMSGWPQSATVRTLSDCELVQIRLPALRSMRRKSAAFKEHLDAIYRETSLAEQLRAAPLFQGCDPAFLDELRDQVELVSCEPGEVIASEGGVADALYLVRSGFLRLSQKLDGGAGELVVNYLSKGMTFGEVELLVGETGGLATTARAVEYAELVKLPQATFRRLLEAFPAVEKRLWKQAMDRIRENGATRRDVRRSDFLETALEEGWVQGNAILVIDLDQCTRCDDCVRACAATHDGRPRFVREGEKYANLEIATACYHCRDPVCLVGCPTGAIHRTGVGAIVAIAEQICIGCGTCARACPYDSIVMHDLGELWPDDMVPEGLRGRPRQVASKCDLCVTRSDGPACVKNCPNGCAYRVGSLEELEDLLRS